LAPTPKPPTPNPQSPIPNPQSPYIENISIKQIYIIKLK